MLQMWGIPARIRPQRGRDNLIVAEMLRRQPLEQRDHLRLRQLSECKCFLENAEAAVVAFRPVSYA